MLWGVNIWYFRSLKSLIDLIPESVRLHPPTLIHPSGSCPSAAEYQILCGNQAPGFIIDIHTGKPVGEFITSLTQPLLPHQSSVTFYPIKIVEIKEQ